MMEGLLPADQLALLRPDLVSPGILALVCDDAPTRTVLCAGGFEIANVTLTEGARERGRNSGSAPTRPWRSGMAAGSRRGVRASRLTSPHFDDTLTSRDPGTVHVPKSDAPAFLFALRKRSAPSACAALFRDAIAPFGFDTFACGEVDRRDRDRNVFYVMDWPESWRRFYVESGLIDRDPLIDELDRRRDPFTWSDLRADRKISKVGRQALDLAAAQGWREGLVVPIPQGGNRLGLVSMVGRDPGLDQASREYLTLISICLHGHVRSLVSQAGFAAPPVGLTERELACLRLASRGLADGAIAKELGVAPSTAHEFIEKAKRRFKTRSRTELVAIAVALGIIDI